MAVDKSKIEKNKPVADNKTAAVEVPVLVKVISVLEYIGSGIMALLGLLFIFGAGFIGSFLPQPFSAVGSAIVIFLGILMLGWAVFEFFIAKGLWKGKNWARIVVIVISCLGVLMGLISVISGNFTSLLGLVLNGLIGGYLLFNDDVKKTFEK